MATTSTSPFFNILAYLGGVSALYVFYRFASSVYLYARPSSLPRYLHGGPSNPPWALVSGASDGIGQGFAHELSHRGFNVILHGRNETKLARVMSELEKQYPNRQYRTFIADASQIDSRKFEALVASLQKDNINLTVLVNNVGGGPGQGEWTPLEALTSAHVDGYIDMNARFPTQLTRALLPILYANGAALILNIGSVSSDFPAAYLTVYSGSKAFNKSWSRSLQAEMRAEGRDVEVLGINVFYVQSQATKYRATGFFTPSSRGMARAALGVVGCGKAMVFGYWPHALQAGLLGLLPEALTQRIAVGMARKEKAKRWKTQ